MLEGERQVAPTVDSIRRDHVARYEWAARYLDKRCGTIVDAACGVGYGTNILAKQGFEVVGIDRDKEAIAYARKHYRHTHARFAQADVGKFEFANVDAAVCFETIEHIENPAALLEALKAPLLLASVPNEDVFPWAGHAFHERHYTKPEFEQLLNSTGWHVTEWYGQQGPESEVERDCQGRTLIAVAKRGKKTPAPVSFVDARLVPAHVVILGLGPSLESYVDISKRLGNRHRFADEVWAINAVGSIVQCDRVFHMDDVRIQEIRSVARPRSNIAAMLEWIKAHPGPVYTSRAHADYPGLVEFPFEDVINSTGHAYLNNTAAYAVAYAIHIGVKKISVFGCDYTYPNAHDAEKGRGCMEFWLGYAAAKGVQLSIPRVSSLMDAMVPEGRRYYGYDTVHVKFRRGRAHTRVAFEPREKLPTAEEIEDLYDHDRHPNDLVK